MKRRDVIFGTATAAFSGVVLYNAASGRADAVVQADGLTQDDFTVDGGDASLDRVTVSPQATVVWSGFDEAVHSVTLETGFRVDGKGPDEWGAVGRPWSKTYAVDSSGTDGRHSIDEEVRVIVFRGQEARPHGEGDGESADRTYQIEIDYAVTVNGSDDQPVGTEGRATYDGTTSFAVHVDEYGTIDLSGEWRAEAKA